MENQSSNAKLTKRDSPNKDYVGTKFNKLLIVKDKGFRILKSGEKKRIMECLCDCGKVKIFDLALIKKGSTKSCGCYNVEVVTKRNTTHGMKGTRFYNIYKDMNKRCCNKNCNAYKSYGGRGIKNLFGSFENFKDTMLATYDKELSLERIDVNGHYSPSNCTWIPFSEQAWNKRCTLKFNGISIGKYCNENNIKYRTVADRVRRGWDIEKAINTPKMKHRYDKQAILC